MSHEQGNFPVTNISNNFPYGEHDSISRKPPLIFVFPAVLLLSVNAIDGSSFPTYYCLLHPRVAVNVVSALSRSCFNFAGYRTCSLGHVTKQLRQIYEMGGTLSCFTSKTCSWECCKLVSLTVVTSLLVTCCHKQKYYNL